MTNFEVYKDEFADIEFAIVGGKLINCHETKCGNCLFDGFHSCADARLKWLEAEHVAPPVDWTKVKVDTPILVSCNGAEWHRRYFARYEKGKVWAWNLGATSWTTDDDDIVDWNYTKLAGVDE